MKLVNWIGAFDSLDWSNKYFNTVRDVIIYGLKWVKLKIKPVSRVPKSIFSISHRNRQQRSICAIGRVSRLILVLCNSKDILLIPWKKDQFFTNLKKNNTFWYQSIKIFFLLLFFEHYIGKIFILKATLHRNHTINHASENQIYKLEKGLLF